MANVSTKKKYVVTFAIATAISIGMFHVYDAIASEKNSNNVVTTSMTAIGSLYDSDVECIYKQILNVTHSKEKASMLSRTITDISFREGVSPLLVASIIEVESLYEENVLSPEGRVGLMGLYPSMIEDKTLKLEKTEDNIVAGTRIIKRYNKMFSLVSDKDTRVKCIVVGYCAGTGYANDFLNGKRKIANEVMIYVNRVMETYHRMQGDTQK